MSTWPAVLLCIFFQLHVIEGVFLLVIHIQQRVESVDAMLT